MLTVIRSISMCSQIKIKGAGIQGLACAWTLKEHHPVLFDTSNKVGGWIQTFRNNEYLFEEGPRGFRPKGKGLATLQLIKELGLESELVAPSDKSHIRYIYRNNRLEPFPNKFKDIFSPLGFIFFKGIVSDLIKPKRDYQTLFDYFNYRFGSSFTHEILDPAIAGIYAGDIKQLSFAGCFPDIEKVARENRSLVLGMLKNKTPKDSKWSQFPLLSLRNGMSTLIETLSKHFPIHLNQTCVADIDCTPPQTSKASLIVVNLGFKDDVLKRPGFGYLVPSYLNEPVLGCVFDSNLFPEQNLTSTQTRLTMMLRWDEYDDLISLVQNTLSRHLNIQRDPDFVRIIQARNAIPQYFTAFGKGNGVNDAIFNGIAKGRSYGDRVYKGYITSSF